MENKPYPKTGQNQNLLAIFDEIPADRQTLIPEEDTDFCRQLQTQFDNVHDALGKNTTSCASKHCCCRIIPSISFPTARRPISCRKIRRNEHLSISSCFCRSRVSTKSYICTMLLAGDSAR